MSGLTIYKASAGSGKTFTLALEYIRTILRDPPVFRNILAVTFTHKATAEMKLRILRELKRMAAEQDSKYLEILMQETGMDEADLRRQARRALHEILHHYSWFSVGTIDSFFQRIIRNFTRETGQTGSFTIELDEKRLIYHAIELLMSKMDQNEDLRKWLTNYALSNIQEGRSWEIRNSMKDLAEQIVAEEYQEQQSLHTGSLFERKALDAFIQKMQSIRYSFENELKSIAKEALSVMDSLDLGVEDFSGKSTSIASMFVAFLRGKFDALTDPRRKALDDFQRWATKDSPKKELIRSAYDSGMRSCLQKTIKLFDREGEQYQTAVRVLKEVYNLGVLRDLSGELHEYTREQNLFLISDAAAFLNGIIRENETPFIYEKAGNRYQHFMIDEFQDTSRLQWKNFHPLLNNSLAQDFSNLVVGDVKQSIYRWRNSDWDILAGQVETAFAQQEVKVQPLLTNYRSREEVIRFNNIFFDAAARHLDALFKTEADAEGVDADRSLPTVSLQEAYADVVQDIPDHQKGSGGCTELSFADESNEEDWKDAADQMLVKKIMHLQDQGYKARDMVVLVRYAKHGRRVASLLLEAQNQLPPDSPYNLRVVSSESLYVNASAAVRLLVAAMKYLQDPEDDLNKAFLVYEYHLLHHGGKMDGEKLERLFSGLMEKEPAEPGTAEKGNGIPEELLHNRNGLKKLPLYELAEQLVQILKLSNYRVNAPYLQAFLDMVQEYTTRESPALDTFLAWWEERSGEQSVNVAENQDAIRILTIHKAKGLEFDVVLVPYCDWEMGHGKHHPVLWVQPREEPFSQMPLLPIRYSSKLTGTYFKLDYLTEKQKSLVDNLNLLYVAFTRARDVLMAMGPARKKPDPLKNAGDLVFRVCRELQQEGEKEMTTAIQPPEPEIETMAFGKIPPPGTETPEEQTNLEPDMESWKPAGRLSLRYDSADFLEVTHPEQALRINYGTLMHDLFKEIRTVEDLLPSLERMVLKGRIPEENQADILEEARKALQHPVAREWFRPGWQVLPERSILTPAGGRLRPDRVMVGKDRTLVVDFKFGDREETAYARQVRGYMSRLRDMGYHPVEGYLWYVKLGKVDKISWK